MADDKEIKGKFTKKLAEERANKTPKNKDFNARFKSPTKKNTDRIGGANTLPKKKDGRKIDHSKIIKDGKENKNKPFTERDGIKKPENKSATTKSNPTTKKNTTPPKKVTSANGINRLKITATKNTLSKKEPIKKLETPRKATPANGINKLKITASKNAPAKKVETPKKNTPVKGISKFKATMSKINSKPKAKAPVKKAPTKGRGR